MEELESEVKGNSNKILFFNHHKQSKAAQIALNSDISFLIEVIKAMKDQFLEDLGDSKNIFNDNVVETVRNIKTTGPILHRKTFLDHEILIYTGKKKQNFLFLKVAISIKGRVNIRKSQV